MKRTSYDILGVDVGANAVEIKRAYRALVKLHHPDVNGSAANAERFIEIADAYCELIESIKNLETPEPVTAHEQSDFSALREMLDRDRGPIIYAPGTLKVDICRIMGEDRYFVDVELPRSRRSALLRMNIEYDTVCPKCGGDSMARPVKCFLCHGEGKYSSGAHLEVEVGPVKDAIGVYRSALREFPLTVLVYPV